jgi:hypothetical protein
MQRVCISKEAELLLKGLYPLMNWDNIRFYEPLPYFMRKGFVIAMALPATYLRKRLDIHLKRYDCNDVYHLATLVHECYHAHQYQRLATFWEFGYCRRFMVYYLGWYVCLYAKNMFKFRFDRSRVSYESYRFHPFEIPAYDMEARFLDWYRLNRVKIDANMVLNFEDISTNCLNSETRPPFVGIIVGFLLCLGICVVKPTVELIRWIWRLK